MPATTRISHQRKELLAQYATAAVCLYGVLSTSEFADVFNHYEEAHTTEEEALLALTRLAKTDDVEYSICANIISGPEFQPEFDDYEEVVEDIRQHQKGKPRYLPSKEEFLKYTNFSYYEPEKPYADLRAHILKNQLTTRGTGVRGVDGDLLDLRELILLGATVTDEIDYFSEHGYKFKGKDDVSEFAQLLMEVHNNTRIYVNNGFTPMELFEQYGRPKLKPLPKIGRNEPCPCGSGLKYKRCCGRTQ